MKESKIYSAHLSYVYKTDDGSRREKTNQYVFRAEDDQAAIRSMTSLVQWCEKQLGQFYNGMFVGCIKLNEYLINPPAEDGSCNNTQQIQFFEWKYDWGGTLAEHIQIKINKYKK